MPDESMMYRVPQYIGQQCDNVQIACGFLFKAGCLWQADSVFMTVIV